MNNRRISFLHRGKAEKSREKQRIAEGISRGAFVPGLLESGNDISGRSSY